ncbi:hypothetical protein SKUN_00363 [Spiroplasma kunkelii CR2-3x]|uniref:Spiroplasmavirus-related protein n=1 Tax=Spiroplasma kunkelii CR2-3x TaxID=273035 RepID=A0A0K2JFD1_SPIKU|nr:hypothetical protein SKUN_00363 [Spiroplasma kunkelii CR2-3x]
MIISINFIDDEQFFILVKNSFFSNSLAIYWSNSICEKLSSAARAKQYLIWYLSSF